MENNKVLLVYNPLAGNGLFRSNMDILIEQFQRAGMQLVPVRLGGDHGDLDRAMSRPDMASYRKIIAAGGDGTFHAVVNSMLKHDLNLPLALFPAGTANDFAYYFDIPHSLDGMMSIALSENYTEADLGVMNGEYFINVAALGPVVSVSQKTDPEAKNALGLMAYYLKGASELPALKPVDITVKSREFSGTVPIYFMLVMNGRSAGGFRKVSPQAEVNDGLLDVYMFKAMTVKDIPNFLYSVVAGTHSDNKNVVYFQTASLRVESEADLATDMDGEEGRPLPLDISLVPRKLRINTALPDMDGNSW